VARRCLFSLRDVGWGLLSRPHRIDALLGITGSGNLGASSLARVCEGGASPALSLPYGSVEFGCLSGLSGAASTG